MEIREILPPNSGRDAPPTFLSRNKLPKDFNGLRLPGENATRTVLNVFGQLNKQRYILDNLKVTSKAGSGVRIFLSLSLSRRSIDRCGQSAVLQRSGSGHRSTVECLRPQDAPDRLR